MKSAIAAVIMCMILAQPGNAQNGPLTINIGGVARPTIPPQTMTITFQLSLPSPGVSSSTDMTKAMTAATQDLYDIVNQECGVLAATLKGSCRLVRLSSTGNFNDANIPTFGNHPNGPVVNANATATFEIGDNAPAAAMPAPTPAVPAPATK
jgi:hypothetical protein